MRPVNKISDGPEVTLLMATYNGMHFIREQLDSLLSQTYTKWKLVIRDDGSKDKTVDIINEYISRHTNISLIINDTSLKGACANFAGLFDIAIQDNNIRYIMFCDQDDIWKPEKIQTSINAMLAMEQEYPRQPVLIYGDFELIDSEGKYMPGEFKLKTDLQLKNLLSFNSVYGCTTILNRELVDKIGAIPADAINHDYWIALVACMFKSQYLPHKLLKYRQHTNNASGNVAGNNGIAARLKRNLFSPGKEIANLGIRLKMFRQFYDKYKSELSTPDKTIITAYLEAFKQGRLKICYVMLRDKIFRKGFFQTLSTFAQVLLFYNRIKPQAV